MTTVAILMPGDMGHGVGQALIAEGHRAVCALDGRSQHTRGLAGTAGMEDLGTLEQAVAAADVVLSILPPDRAVAQARDVASAMQTTGARPVYVDCNAISPATLDLVAAEIQATGATFIDCGIVGLNPIKTPPTRFYVSGPDCTAMKALESESMQVKVIGTSVGQASALKMVYAAGTKGVWTLQTALLLTAMRLGVIDPLVEELEYSQSAQIAAMRNRVPFLPADAARWVPEMQEIAATFASAGVTDKFHLGAAEIFSLLDQSAFATETRATLDRTRTLEQALSEYATHIGEK